MLTLGIGQPPEMADADKAPGEDVEKIAPDELPGVQCHRLLLVSGLVIFPAKGHSAIFETDQMIATLIIRGAPAPY